MVFRPDLLLFPPRHFPRLPKGITHFVSRGLNMKASNLNITKSDLLGTPTDQTHPRSSLC